MLDLRAVQRLINLSGRQIVQMKGNGVMNKGILIGLGLAIISASGGIAQTNVTTTGGTANTVPLFTGSTTLGPSAITQSGTTNIGIGTSSPATVLDVNGSIHSASTSNALIIGQIPTTGLSSEYAVRDQPSIIVNGYVGGTTPNFSGDSIAIYDFRNTTESYTSGFPPPTLYLGKSRSGNAGAPGGTSSSVLNGDILGALSFVGDNGTDFANQGAYISTEVDGSPNSTSIPGRIIFATTTANSTNPVERMRITSTGNVQISTALRFANDASGVVQTTAWTGVLCGGDYAETVDVAGDRKNYEPGDVLVIDSDSGSDVLKSAEPYSKLVAGIYSTKPGVVGRRQTVDAKTSTTEIPMAMIGIVPTKVSAENGSIKRGDLLVTSSTLGYAMKGTDATKMPGAVVGKALGSLDYGTGVIEVLVTLQ